VAWCHRTMLAYWKFESISLQQRVRKLSVPLDRCGGRLSRGGLSEKQSRSAA